MDQMEAFRELLEVKFDAVDRRLDGQDRILGEIKEQTTRTNGRVNVLEKLSAGFIERFNAITDMLRGHGRELGELKRARRPEPNVEAGENRVLRVWMLWAAVGLIVSTIAVLGFFGYLKKPGDIAAAPTAVIR